jgi:ferredoxin-NADP reductase
VDLGSDEFDVRVAARCEVAEGVVAFGLEDPVGADLPPWTPGSHVDLVLGPDLIRQYSLCGDPNDRQRWRIAVLLEPDGRGGSLHLHHHVSNGDRLRIRGPRNNFALEPARHYEFIAGGIGITPILPMISAVHRSGAEWTLHYGGRARRSMAFVDELDPYGDRVKIRPQDIDGLLDLDSALGRVDSDTLVYGCGPPALIAAVEQRCQQLNPAALCVERFSNDVLAAGGDSPQFTVELVSTGATFVVAHDETILSVLDASGITVPYSCKGGLCGTCETAVIEGDVDHRDVLLTDAEKASNATMMICVSRANSPKLVLDL